MSEGDQAAARQIYQEVQSVAKAKRLDFRVYIREERDGRFKRQL